MAAFCITIVPPLIVNEDVVPVDGISKLAMVALAFGVASVPIDVVSVPPLMVKAMEFVDVAVDGANLAAIFIAPPSIVNTALLPHVSESLLVPTL